MLAWEQERLDHAVADVFGFHALQLGLPELDGLRANRMPHRWVSTDSLIVPEPMCMPPPADDSITTLSPPMPMALHCDPDALPFPNESLDLVLMPHTLELARDPHQALAEVTRVLRPEGRLMIVGLNPASLWGLRQRTSRLKGQLGVGHGAPFLPRTGEFIGYWRLRDWLRLLGFEIDSGRFGCYRPAFNSERWLQRFGWMEHTGDRWWPVLGAMYFLAAVKRVRGMRLVGLARSERVKPKAAPAVVANRQQRTTETIDD